MDSSSSAIKRAIYELSFVGSLSQSFLFGCDAGLLRRLGLCTTHEQQKTVMLVRNAVWNLAGQILPLTVAIAVIPILLKLMGTEGFGLVAIIWTLIGYFSLFDFGLGRALTKYISVELGYEKPLDIADIVVTGMSLLAIIGVVIVLVCTVVFGKVVVQLPVTLYLLSVKTEVPKPSIISLILCPTLVYEFPLGKVAVMSIFIVTKG